MEALTLSLEEPPEPGTAHAVEEIINQYNCSVMQSDYRPLQITLRNAQGEVVGGPGPGGVGHGESFRGGIEQGLARGEQRLGLAAAAGRGGVVAVEDAE